MSREGLVYRIYQIIRDMESRKTRRCEIRLTPAAYSQIQKIVKEEECPSVADYVRQLVMTDLTERKIEKNIKEKILELVQTDEELRNEIRKILQ